MTNGWATVKIKEAAAASFRKTVDTHPEQGFNSLADFLTRAGLEYALRLEQGPRPVPPVTSSPPATAAPSTVPPPAPHEERALSQGEARGRSSSPRSSSSEGEESLPPTPEAAPSRPGSRAGKGAARDGDVHLAPHELERIRSVFKELRALPLNQKTRDVELAALELAVRDRRPELLVGLTEGEQLVVLEDLLEHYRAPVLTSFSPRSSKSTGAAAG